jgi:hypothetical protein
MARFLHQLRTHLPLAAMLLAVLVQWALPLIETVHLRSDEVHHHAVLSHKAAHPDAPGAPDKPEQPADDDQSCPTCASVATLTALAALLAMDHLDAGATLAPVDPAPQSPPVSLELPLALLARGPPVC